MCSFTSLCCRIDAEHFIHCVYHKLSYNGAPMQATSIKAKKLSVTAVNSVSIWGAGDPQAQAEQVTKLLNTFTNPDWLLLLFNLVEGERSFAELGVLNSVAQPSLSQYLSVLRTQGLVARGASASQSFIR